MPMRNKITRYILLLWLLVIVLLASIIYYLFSNSISFLSYPTEMPSGTPAIAISPSQTPVLPQYTVTPRVQATPTLSPTSTPPNISRQIIGTSVAGRPLEVYQFGTGSIEKMIVAGIHGGYEWNTIILADELIEYLSNHPEVVPSDQTLYILRAFNPDGFARSRGFGGRANDNNVDLNRNFPSKWQPDWPRDGCWDYIPITGGTAAASEPETRALIDFITNHDLKALISYHSAALGIFPGGQPLDPASVSLAETIAAVSDYPYPPIEAGCVYTGQFVDWAVDQGIPAVDIELTNHQDSDYAINLGILSVFLDWTAPEEISP
jgi:hypothetical protein